VVFCAVPEHQTYYEGRAYNEGEFEPYGKAFGAVKKHCGKVIKVREHCGNYDHKSKFYEDKENNVLYRFCAKTHKV
jgi:hypothetical protein